MSQMKTVPNQNAANAANAAKQKPIRMHSPPILLADISSRMEADISASWMAFAIFLRAIFCQSA